VARTTDRSRGGVVRSRRSSRSPPPRGMKEASGSLDQW
jgi:hypothetical protein